MDYFIASLDTPMRREHVRRWNGPALLGMLILLISGTISIGGIVLLLSWAF